MPALETPVLFLVFNRPEQTARVFGAIRSARPKKLFVAADGPRKARIGEEEVCARTRAIATAVDWPCEVTTLFRDENLGCGPAVSGAITWFFEQVEEGIILEDDCLPHQDFFPYCQTLLERYREEPRVATIAGTHFLPATLPYQHSHYLSKYFQMWGWATWRRTWRHYDFKLASLSDSEWWELLQRTHPISVEAGYWREVYRALTSGNIDTWDFQMYFCCWRLGAAHIMPGRNLISNLGYEGNATHTNFPSPMGNLPTHSLSIGPEPVPLDPQPAVDNIIFYLRYLESMTQTWWVEQVLSPEGKLGEARAELARKERYIRQIEIAVVETRRQLRLAAASLARSPRQIPLELEH